MLEIAISTARTGTSTRTPPADGLWGAVVARDVASDGAFVYAVRTTGVFCRPSCASRQPRRENVAFFSSAAAARAVGYRACKRCEPEAAAPGDPASEKLAAVCRALEAAGGAPVPLRTLATGVGLSPSHLQRLFKRALGISPRQYADALRLGRLKGELRGGTPIAAALYESGYGSSSRLYEAAPHQLGMTPRAYQRAGAGECIRFAVVPCALGHVLLAATVRGVCSLRLGDDPEALEAELRREFANAEIVPEEARLAPWLAAVAAYLAGDSPGLELPLDVRATAFERRVFEALRAIPPGETLSYGELAARLGRPGAARAVGRACARNPVALALPCHRVVPKSGRGTGGYRWGEKRKRALLELESGATAPRAASRRRAKAGPPAGSPS